MSRMRGRTFIAVSSAGESFESGVDARVGQLDVELVAYDLRDYDLDDAHELRQRLDKPDGDADAEEFLRVAGVGRERPADRQHFARDVGGEPETRLDGFVVYVEPAELEGEALDVRGEHDGTVGGGGKSG